MIDKESLAMAMLTAWDELGIKIECPRGAIDSNAIYISVPETSDHLDAHGEPMAGMHLAKRIQETLREMGATDFVVRARVRKGDHIKTKRGNT